MTGNDLDNREAFFGKFQFQLKATENFDARLLVSFEHDGDGDYALGDLAGIRATPHRVSRDFEGFTQRDVVAPTLLLNLTTDTFHLTSITGGVWWKTTDSTDLDYSPASLATRWNREEQYQISQEFRLSSLKDKPLELGNDLTLAWQSGLFVFDQNYQQSAFNDLLSPYLTYPAPAPLRSGNRSTLTDWGTGLYAQGKLTAWKKLDITAGVRFDYENKNADLNSFTIPALSRAITSALDDDFAAVSPQLALAYHITPEQMVYADVARGFKAGGFNSLSPVGKESYGMENSWNYEIGLKSEWLEGKLRANLALFYIDWNHVQLNVPVPGAPGQFFIDNAGAANSKGAELELNYRPVKGLDLFASVGYADARFNSGSMSEGIDVGGHRLPYAPQYTVNAGTQFSWDISRFTVYARAQVTVYGDFKYDPSNLQGQSTYSIADFRVGVRTGGWFAEGWIDNAFDTRYVPLAFEYPFAQSGYIGESGAPTTAGVRFGFRF